MMSFSSRLFTSVLVLSLAGLSAACDDSGHSLGTSLGPEAGAADLSAGSGGTGGSGGVSNPPSGGSSGLAGAKSAGGSTGTGGSAGSSTSAGGAGGGAGGRGGSSTADDAGSDGAGGCGYRGESCASRPCCSPLICLSLTSQTTCMESMPPPRDSAIGDTPTDTQCPACPPMKCAYGMPVDKNGCTVCECNPPPDGGVDTSSGCGLPEGCIDAGPSTPCPSTPPEKDSACVGQSVCSYEDCPGTGHIQASCRSGKWAIASGACGTVTCLGVSTSTTCASGQACLVRIGGMLSVSCIANPCGSGLVSADCSSTTADCTPIFSTTSGLTFYCDTCPGDGTCA